MKKDFFKKVTLGCLLGLLFFSVSCCINIGCLPRAKYETQVRLSAPMQPGSTFQAVTHNGSITINGADVTDCNLTATITAYALTEEDAKKLAEEEIKIKLEPSGNKLTVNIEKPSNMQNRSVSVSLIATVPNQTHLELNTHNGAIEIENITGNFNGTTHNGAVKIANITGDINGTTHNGKVVARNTRGNNRLKTHNGAVICEEISGDAQLITHNGSIEVYYCEDAPSVCNISMVTHNGSIDFTAPPGLSAVVEASTHNGSINTDIPITLTLTGEINKKKITGTIGAGEGKLHLETHNGSIKIR